MGTKGGQWLCRCRVVGFTLLRVGVYAGLEKLELQVSCVLCVHAELRCVGMQGCWERLYYSVCGWTGFRKFTLLNALCGYAWLRSSHCILCCVGMQG